MLSDLGIILLSCGIGIGSFAAGSIPLALKLSPEKFAIVNTYAAGLLVGTALIIIVPEGVDALYSINKTTEPIHHNYPSKQASVIQLNNQIGLSLAFGFAFMFLVDTVFSHGHQQYHSPLTELTQDYHELSNDPINANQVSAISKRRSYSAMIGLIIHSAADGLALGAAGHSNSQWIIFMALMLHKAPAAFGLTSFLIKDGLSRRNVRGALFMFSIAAPISIFLLKIAAIITSLLIDLSGYEDTTGSSMFWSGVVLLFSGGAFLYVSLVHILPEIYINSASSPSAHPSKGQLTVMQVILVVLGIFSPFFLAMGHHH